MRFNYTAMVFSLLFALGIVLYTFGMEASASHGDGTGITAEQVAADPGNEEKMRAFLDHIFSSFGDITRELMGETVLERSRKLTILAREFRESETYHHGEIYAITINTKTMRVTNHPKYPGLLGYGFNPDARNSDVAGTLKTLLENSVVGMTNCARYGQNNDRVACATRIEEALIGNLTVVVGIHHAEGDGLFEPPDCPGFGFELETSAEDVYGDPTVANLQAYVKGIIGVTQKGMQEVTEAVIAEDPLTAAAAATDPAAAIAFQAKLIERFSDRIACYGLGDFKHGNIYAFIMGTDPAGTVILNANNPDLNGLNLEADDNELPGDDKSISGLFRNALTGGSGEPQAGQSATTCYRWDDPSDPDDTIPDWFETGLVPGSSPKVSYIEVADLFEDFTILGRSVTPQLMIFGSGIYPEDTAGHCPDMGEADDDEGACAIAGAGHTSQSALLNLFLIASVLFSFVFLRRRT